MPLVLYETHPIRQVNPLVYLSTRCPPNTRLSLRQPSSLDFVHTFPLFPWFSSCGNVLSDQRWSSCCTLSDGKHNNNNVDRYRNSVPMSNSSVVVVVVVVFAHSTQRQRQVHPVSVLILHPREIQIMWSQTDTQRKPPKKQSQTNQGT